jgi:hypothetical protein
VVAKLKSRGIIIEVKDIFLYQTIELLTIQINQDRIKQEVFIDANQIARMLMGERDEFHENEIEAII